MCYFPCSFSSERQPPSLLPPLLPSLPLSLEALPNHHHRCPPYAPLPLYRRRRPPPFDVAQGESLLMALKNIAVSSGSACTSASLEPSYVLRAIGVEDDLAHTSMRFGIGRFTTEEEVDFAVESLAVHVERLRSMSPLWEMVQEGI
ncbi:unnamed protein product, partial [Laminaria digitata]